ncbi:MAG: transglutaminase domain-containing protein [Gammaproteobacteria bacterium]|nr:transglutaminase domain-containing protein [Gammaproteobacteria bacterium]
MLSQEKIVVAKNVVEKLAQIQDEHRVYNTSEDGARLFGFNKNILEQLVEAGASYQTHDAIMMFDSDDLYNYSLYLELPSIHKLAMRSWAKVFKNSSGNKKIKISYSFQNDVKLPNKFQVITEKEKRSEMIISEPKSFYQSEIVIRNELIDLPNTIKSLLIELSEGIEFYMLHDAIRWDTDFIAKHKMAECGGFSKLVMEQALIIGHEARQVFGVMLSEPYGTGHYWVEFKIGTDWIAVDPLMIVLLTTHTTLSPEDWKLYRIPFGVLLRLFVIKDYDSIGAPCFEYDGGQQFFKHPIVTSGDTEYPLTFSIT